MATPAQAIPLAEQNLIATGADVDVRFVSDLESGDVFLTPAMMLKLVTTATQSKPLEQTVEQTREAFDTTLIAPNIDAADHNLESLLTASIQETAEQSAAGSEEQAAGSTLSTDEQAVVAVQTAFVEIAGADGGGGGAETALAAVDEPSSLLMFSFGLGAIVFAMKRQAIRR